MSTYVCMYIIKKKCYFFNEVKNIYLLPVAEEVVIFMGLYMVLWIRLLNSRSMVSVTKSIVRFLNNLLMFPSDSVFHL